MRLEQIQNTPQESEVENSDVCELETTRVPGRINRVIKRQIHSYFVQLFSAAEIPTETFDLLKRLEPLEFRKSLF